jgi:hypothetical protein
MDLDKHNGKNANDMGKKDFEKNIRPNIPEWTLEN